MQSLTRSLASLAHKPAFPRLGIATPQLLTLSKIMLT
jgi:hypothetical protein